ncbi:MAG: asparagine synthase (glutamine-hydrolyzing) [Chlamydiota bacterium]
MCGIAGICSSISQEKIDQRLLETMTQLIRHRGPDEWGVHAEAGIGLANVRLSIIDLHSGHQPMHNEDGSVWITFNGEIFNYVELRQELIARGHRFATQSDTEVVLHLYEEKGEDCVHDLNGQWGLAIWDGRERKLFLSRDRLGVRPLFYTLADGKLIFGSEIKAIFAHPAVRRELDLLALDQIFTFWFTLPPRTIFRDICELPPGHSLVFKNGNVSTHRYWQLDFENDAGCDRPEQEYAEELRALLLDATRIRLRSDVPVGAYLSGGLDSTIVTALIRHFSSAQLRTFSVAFTARELDESRFQQEAIAHLGTAHEQVSCGYGDIAAVFPAVIWHTEKPVIRAAPAPMYLLSRLVRDSGFKVVLTGEGADEVFGGYDIFKEAKIRRFWAAQPGSLRRARLLRRLYPYQNRLQQQSDAYLQSFFRIRPEGMASPFFSHLPRWELTARLKFFLSEEVKAALGGYDCLAELAAQLPDDYSQWHSFCRAQYLEAAYLLPAYILSSQGDRVGMAHAVECRHPYLDYRIVELGARMPPQLKMKVLNEKYILKRAFGHLLPSSIAKRPKQPYRAPDGRSFFTGTTPEYVEHQLSAGAIRSSGLFDARSVGALTEKFKAGRAIGVKDDMALIGILSTQLVMDKFIAHFRQEVPRAAA